MEAQEASPDTLQVVIDYEEEATVQGLRCWGHQVLVARKNQQGCRV